MKRTTKQAISPATVSPAPRLLPWPGSDGKLCYLVTDNGGGHVSRLADDLEAVLLAVGVDVLALARPLLDDPASPYTEVRYAGLRLAECLADALRVAESRGMRLPAPDAEDGGRATQETKRRPTSAIR
ncbi:hypothetical protein [Streptomyces phaeochromogenes]